MEIIAWIATVLSIFGIVLNAKKLILCWFVWILSNILWIIYFSNNFNLQSLILWVVFCLFNIYGWIQWKKDKKPQNEKD